MECEVEAASADEDPRGEVDGHDVERLAALAEGGATQEAAERGHPRRVGGEIRGQKVWV